MKTVYILCIVYLFCFFFQTSFGDRDPWNPFDPEGTKYDLPFYLNEKVNMSYKVFPEPSTWIEAVVLCRSLGSELALPENREQANELIEMMDRLKVDGPTIELFDRIHAGFHHRFKPFEFVSLMGESIENDYYKWTKLSEEVMKDKRCGVFNFHSLYDVSDCNTFLPFICQIPRKVSIPMTIKDFEERPNIEYLVTSPTTLKKFTLHKTPRTWIDANALCKAGGGELATIESAKEYEITKRLINLAQNVYQYSHVNKKFSKPNERIAYLSYNNYFGNTGTVYGSKMMYDYQFPIQPGPKKNQHCVVAATTQYYYENAFKFWDCEDELIYICEKFYTYKPDSLRLKFTP